MSEKLINILNRHSAASPLAESHRRTLWVESIVVQSVRRCDVTLRCVLTPGGSVTHHCSPPPPFTSPNPDFPDPQTLTLILLTPDFENFIEITPYA